VRQLELSIKQQLFEKLHGVLSKELNKIGCEYVDHGETFITGVTDLKGKKLTIKIEVK